MGMLFLLSCISVSQLLTALLPRHYNGHCTEVWLLRAVSPLQALPPSSKLISIEKDLSWWLVAKRFIWQASQGEKNKQRQMPLGNLVGAVYSAA